VYVLSASTNAYMSTKDQSINQSINLLIFTRRVENNLGIVEALKKASVILTVENHRYSYFLK